MSEEIEDGEDFDPIAEEVINKHYERLNEKVAKEDRPVGAFDPMMNGAVAESEANASEGVATEKVGKNGRMRRPVLAVGIWAKLATLKPITPLVMSDGKQISFCKAADFDMYLLTNRMIKVKDHKADTHVYCPCENVAYFTVKGDDGAEKRLSS